MIKVQYIKRQPIDVGRNYSNVVTNSIRSNKHFSKRFFCLGLGCDSFQRRSCGIFAFYVQVSVMFKIGHASPCIYGLLLHCTWEGTFYGCVEGL